MQTEIVERLRIRAACFSLAPLSLAVCIVALAALLFALLIAPVASAASVVMVPAAASKAWQTAESRLIAELRASGVDILLLPPQPPSDGRLHVYPEEYDAAAAVQVQRDHQQGVIRIWLREAPGLPGGFRHIAVDLRGVNVVSQAVLPTVELVFAQIQALAAASEAEPGSARGVSVRNGWRRSKPGLQPLPPQRKTRAETLVLPRVGVGPWFSGAAASAAVAVAFGAQVKLLPVLFLVPELTLQPVPHEVSTDLEVHRSDKVTVTAALTGVRGFVMFEPWSSTSVSAGIGAGGGVILSSSSLRGAHPDGATTSLLAARAQLATEVALDFDAVFILTANWAMPALRVRRSDARRDARLLRPGVDAMLALDWLWL